MQTDTGDVNNPVKAADDIYLALIFNLDNKDCSAYFFFLHAKMFFHLQSFSKNPWDDSLHFLDAQALTEAFSHFYPL